MPGLPSSFVPLLSHIRYPSMRLQSLMALVLLTLFSACNSQTPPPAKQTTQPVDAVDIAQRIVDAGGKIKKEGDKITQVDLRGLEIDDAMVSGLAELPSLKLLKLAGRDCQCQVSGQSLKQLSTLPQLKVFGADFLPLDSEAAQAIGGLQHLVELYLASADIDDTEFQYLEPLTGLKKLRLSGNSITEESAPTLEAFQSLEELDLSSCKQIGGTAMQAVSKLGQLHKLNLYDIALEDEALVRLAGMTQLQSLNLDGTRLTDEGLAALAGLQQLTFLHLAWTQITDDSLPVLQGFPKLKTLLVHETGMTDRGFETLKQSLPNVKIQTVYQAKED